MELSNHYMLKCKVSKSNYIKYFDNLKSMERYITANSNYLKAYIRYEMISGRYRQIVIYKDLAFTKDILLMLLDGFVLEPSKSVEFVYQ